MPLKTKDLSNLPPALIITAEFDPLRDEGEAYGKKLKENGVEVKISRYDGVVHGFFSMSPALPKAVIAIKESAQALKTIE